MCRPILDMSNRPTTMRKVPTTGNTLYRPQRLTSWPAPVDASSRPPIKGRSRSPDAVGLSPARPGRRWGGR